MSGRDDIFPRIKIGYKSSRAVAIIDGKMWLDNKDTNTTLAEYILRNWSNESIARARQNSFFQIEPGRCMFVSLFAVSRSHMASTIPVDVQCIKRE